MPAGAPEVPQNSPGGLAGAPALAQVGEHVGVLPEGRARHGSARRPPRGTVARATFGQYRDVLSGLRERGGVGEAARGMFRHLRRAGRHRA